MKLNYLLGLTVVLLGLGNCSSRKNTKHENLKIANNKSCIYGLCFKNATLLIDSVLDQMDYNGLLMKVYNINIDKDEATSFDSLLENGYKKLPFDRYDLNEIPENLKSYIEVKDSGYYLDHKKGLDGDKFLILNISKNKLILYDIGALEDLQREDSIKGIFYR